MSCKLYNFCNQYKQIFGYLIFRHKSAWNVNYTSLYITISTNVFATYCKSILYY